MSSVDILSNVRSNGSYSIPIPIANEKTKSFFHEPTSPSDEKSDESECESTLVAHDFDNYMENRLSYYAQNSYLGSYMGILSSPESSDSLTVSSISSGNSVYNQLSSSSPANLTLLPHGVDPVNSNNIVSSSKEEVNDDDDCRSSSVDSDYESKISDNFSMVSGQLSDDYDDDDDESTGTVTTSTSTITSTLSSSPIGHHDFPPLDEKLLEEKFSQLGFNKYTLKGSRSGSSTASSKSLRAAGPAQLTSSDDSSSCSSDNDDDNETSRGPLIRSTSLKTGKTPPGSPRRGKKMVRFADALGLEFEYVKLIRQDCLPIIPKSAYQDLSESVSMYADVSDLEDWEDGERFLSNRLASKKNSLSSASFASSRRSFRLRPSVPGFVKPTLGSTTITLRPTFVQPCCQGDFVERVKSQAICLENCSVVSRAGNISVTCTIRVLNIAFEKSVTIRHTMNNWASWTDATASYQPGSCDGWSDKFLVTFSVSSATAASDALTRPGARLAFAICYKADGREYWDNNRGSDYTLIYVTL